MSSSPKTPSPITASGTFLLGCIAEDLASASTLGAALVHAGMRCTILHDFSSAPTIPGANILPPPDYHSRGDHGLRDHGLRDHGLGDHGLGDHGPDALIIALGSDAPGRSPREAVPQALVALDVLVAAGATQIYLGLSPQAATRHDGVVGGLADALATRLGSGFAPLCLADPERRYRCFQGHLFLGSTQLQEIGGPTEQPPQVANLPLLLARHMAGSLMLVPLEHVQAGGVMLRDTLVRVKESGRNFALLDATTEAECAQVAEAVASQPLLIGSTGLARHLPQAWRNLGLLPDQQDAAALPASRGKAAILAGGALQTGAAARGLLAQIGYARLNLPGHDIVLPGSVEAIPALLAPLLDQAEAMAEDTPALFSTALLPEQILRLRQNMAAEGQSEDGILALEAALLAALARGLVARGVGRMVLAGSAAAPAVLRGMGITQLRVGASVDTGMPWCWAETTTGFGLHVALAGEAGQRDALVAAFDIA